MWWLFKGIVYMNKYGIFELIICNIEKKKFFYLIYWLVNMEYFFKLVFFDIVFYLIFSVILKFGLCMVCMMLILLVWVF